MSDKRLIVVVKGGMVVEAITNDPQLSSIEVFDCDILKDQVGGEMTDTLYNRLLTEEGMTRVTDIEDVDVPIAAIQGQ